MPWPLAATFLLARSASRWSPSPQLGKRSSFEIGITKLGGRDLLLLLPVAEALLLLLRSRSLVNVREKGRDDGAGFSYVTACDLGIGEPDVVSGTGRGRGVDAGGGIGPAGGTGADAFIGI